MDSYGDKFSRWEKKRNQKAHRNSQNVFHSSVDPYAQFVESMKFIISLGKPESLFTFVCVCIYMLMMPWRWGCYKIQNKGYVYVNLTEVNFG